MTTVAVTTSVDGFPRAASALRLAGLEPVPLPCIEVTPAAGTVLEVTRAAAAETDWILVTSRRAVEIVWAGHPMPPTPVAAVGRATARAVTAAGGRPALVGTSDAGSVVRSLGGRAPGSIVLFPAARGDDDHVRRLLCPGRLVHIPVYATRSIPPPPTPVDVVMFGSPSAVRGWLSTRSLDDVTVAAIGSVTAAALIEAGRPPDLVPAVPDFAELARQIATWSPR
jgi:uroporphyrinogen-III synthase